MVTLEFIQPIPKETRGLFSNLIERAKERFDFKHPIIVQVVPAAVIKDAVSGDIGFGCFDYQNKKKLQIVIAGHKLPEFSDEEWPDILIENFCHELAHYEQFRGGKKVQERGVRVRVRSLTKLFAEQ